MKPRYPLIVGLALLAAAAPGLHAQRKPDPKAAQQEPNEPDLKRFAKAYEKAGEPRILVLTGVVQPQGGTQERAATGVALRHGHLGEGLKLFDSRGDAAKLKSDLEQLLLREHRVELVDLASLAERDRREVSLLAQRNNARAIGLLAKKINADLVLVVRMLDTPAIRNRGANYRVSVRAVEPARGRKIAGFGFDWKEGTSSRMIKDYARAVTRKFVEQFANWYRPDAEGAAARKYTVRVIGLDDLVALNGIRQGLAGVEGVDSVRARGFSSDGRQSVGTLAVDYRGGSLQFMAETQQLARQKLGLDVKAVDGSQGTLTLAAGSPPPAPQWIALIHPGAPNHGEALDQLKREYADAGRPKVGIVIDPAIVETGDGEVTVESDGSGKNQIAKSKDEGVSINVNIDRSGDRQSREIDIRNLLDTRRMEDALYKRMIDTGVTMVDPELARARLGEELDRKPAEVSAERVASKLHSAAGLDILIHGVGHVERGNRISYSFRAIRASDSVTLAAESWSSEVLYSHNILEEAGAIEWLSAYTTGKMLDQMLRSWDPPQVYNVRVLNAEDQRQVFEVMKIVENSVDGIESADFERHESGDDGEGGLGIFVLRSHLSFDELVAAIRDNEGKLPFSLDVPDTRRQVLSVRINQEL